MPSEKSEEAYNSIGRSKFTRDDDKKIKEATKVDEHENDDSDNDDDDDKASTRTSTQTVLSQATGSISSKNSITVTMSTIPTAISISITSTFLLSTNTATQAPTTPSIAQTSSKTSPLSNVAATSVPSTSSSSASTGTKTIVLSTVAAAVGTALLIFLALFAYRSLSRRRKSTLDFSSNPPLNGTRQTTAFPTGTFPRRVRSQATNSFWGSTPSDSEAGDIPSVPAMVYNSNHGGVDHQARVGLIRNSLLRPHERDRVLAQSQWPLRLGERQEEMKKDAEGGNRNVTEDERRNMNWNRVKMQEKGTLDIEANGRWEPPITIAARDSRVESVVSMPRWRDPVSWVRDQVERSKK